MSDYYKDDRITRLYEGDRPESILSHKGESSKKSIMNLIKSGDKIESIGGFDSNELAIAKLKGKLRETTRENIEQHDGDPDRLKTVLINNNGKIIENSRCVHISRIDLGDDIILYDCTGVKPWSKAGVTRYYRDDYIIDENGKYIIKPGGDLTWNKHNIAREDQCDRNSDQMIDYKVSQLLITDLQKVYHVKITDAKVFSEELFKVKDINGYRSLMDKEGFGTGSYYDGIANLKDGYSLVKDKHGKRGLINEKGIEVVACTHNSTRDIKIPNT